ncbi:MAG: hypothetical protein HRU49_01795 [Winogradskyella sp.]|uniref:hypothetical protein n=1 Tax=Winogradskyella sp. TaxID=1883156 RepID=UPI0025CED3F0|nr:hypothetical protein [Winogradskyella sp.]NRB82502.1 hypothetical protein [Winogradskyella sp.]
MKKIKIFLSFTAILAISVSYAQRKELNGQLTANDDVEGIHVLNKSAAKFAISDEGGTFRILAKVNDTLFVSSLKYKNKDVVLTQAMIDAEIILIQLEEKINALDKVVVGKILTGSLQSDLENSDAKTEVNFYDLGIPGNTKLPLTQNERKLHDADAGPMGYIGLGFGLNFHKLLNKISGRTKKLKAIVELDDRDRCINRLRADYESIIFETDSLSDRLKNEYFLFCQEGDTFLALCKEKNEMKLLEYMQQKLIQYMENRESVDKN